jgi:drug/metabolite transporter (DMT)-like permease
MNQSAKRPQRLVLILAFLAVYIIWGTTYLANRYGLLGMKPFVLTGLRYTAVAGLLFAWCGIKKLKLPSWKNTKILAASGFLMLVGGSGLVVTGELYINSSSTAIIIATEPLLFLLLDSKNRKAYSPATFIGMVLGFTGIFIFSRFTSGNADALTITGANVVKGTLIVFISAIFWTLGTLVSRRQTDNEASPFANVAIQHVVGALGCLLLATFRGDWKGFDPSHIPAAAWGGLSYLIVMGSLVGFMAFMWLVKIQPPAIVSTHTYVNPIVAVIAGAVLVGEEVGGPQLLALGMVLIGVLLVQAPKLNLFSRQPVGPRQPNVKPEC